MPVALAGAPAHLVFTASMLPCSCRLFVRPIVSLQVPLSSRLPFPANALDLIHVDRQASLGDLPFLQMEGLLFECDRVLRPGGLLWLDLEVKQVRETAPSCGRGHQLLTQGVSCKAMPN